MSACKGRDGEIAECNVIPFHKTPSFQLFFIYKELSETVFLLRGGEIEVLSATGV